MSIKEWVWSFVLFIKHQGIVVRRIVTLAYIATFAINGQITKFCTGSCTALVTIGLVRLSKVRRMCISGLSVVAA